MQITPHFSLEEFIATSNRKVNNLLPQHLMPNAIKTLTMMEAIRTSLSEGASREISIYMSSGYRCLALNRSLGSLDSSDHVEALACDWTAPRFGTPYDICNYLQQRMTDLGIGQLIHEFGRWIHTGSQEPKNPVNRIITIDKSGTRAGIRRI